MIICNSKNFIFIHIPKNGGTSVSKCLERNLRPQDISLNPNFDDGWDKYAENYKKRFGLFKHSLARDVAKSMGPESFKGYYVFTFSRNPFARAYSAYTFTLRTDAKYRPNSERYREIKDMSFEEFLKSRYVQNHELLQTKLQSNWVNGSPKPVAIYRLEEVEASLVNLMKRFYGTNDHKVIVPKANAFNEPDAWKRMSPEAEEIIRALYAEDFMTFGYSDRIER